MKNKKTVYKWWWVWDFEEEEQWLNNMAMEGWVLDGVGFCTYHFVWCEPGTYTIRLEMRGYDNEYMEFMKEMNTEYVGRMAQWIFFRRRSEYGEFDIFSDIDSRIAHFDKIGKLLLYIGILNMVFGFVGMFEPVHVGFLNLLCGCLLMYGLGRIHGKAKELKMERLFHE